MPGTLRAPQPHALRARRSWMLSGRAVTYWSGWACALALCAARKCACLTLTSAHASRVSSRSPAPLAALPLRAAMDQEVQNCSNCSMEARHRGLAGAHIGNDILSSGTCFVAAGKPHNRRQTQDPCTYEDYGRLPLSPARHFENAVNGRAGRDTEPGPVMHSPTRHPYCLCTHLSAHARLSRCQSKSLSLLAAPSDALRWL